MPPRCSRRSDECRCGTTASPLHLRLPLPTNVSKSCSLTAAMEEREDALRLCQQPPRLSIRILAHWVVLCTTIHRALHSCGNDSNSIPSTTSVHIHSGDTRSQTHRR
jgi:hypothetical protein